MSPLRPTPYRSGLQVTRRPTSARRVVLLVVLIAMAVIFAPSGPAWSSPVSLMPNPVDDDGRITLGDLFEGAGGAANVVVATRNGPTAVLDAAQVQAAAARAGLTWNNPSGLRRIIVRQGAGAASARPGVTQTAASAPGATVEVLTYARSLAAGEVVRPEDVIWAPVQAHLATQGGPQDAEVVIGLSARRALRAGAPVQSRDLAAPQVIARGDRVQVVYDHGGVHLAVVGRATRNAALGEAVTIANADSGRLIDAVATGPGQAVAGPAAIAARSAALANPQQFAALH